MIRRVITCDICGTQKQQTNHWFIACEQSGELRIGGWNSRYLQGPETKHLCGETCAHKLTSQFLMRLVNVAMQPAAEESETQAAAEGQIGSLADRATPRSCLDSGSDRIRGSRSW